MLKILLLDYLFPKNHAQLYNNYIELLSKIADLKVIAKKDYYNGYKDKWDGVEIEELLLKNGGSNAFSRKLNSFMAMLKVKNAISKYSSNIKIVLTFDTISFAFGRIFTGSKNTYILHHKNIDEIGSGIKRVLFQTYMNKVKHIVFEDYFKAYLVSEFGVDEERITVIPHPMNNKNSTIEEKDITYDCVGLSNSNDEKFIESIIQVEERTSFLKKANMQVVLRSNKYKFDNGNLKIITGFLEKDIYDNYINKCKCVFVPLPSTFKYRVSGVILDAFSNNKFVVSNNVPIVKSYIQKYPEICFGTNDVEGFFKIISEIKHKEVSETDFHKFKLHHNDNLIIDKFKDALKEE